MKDCNQSLEAGKRKRDLMMAWPSAWGTCPDCCVAVWDPGREGSPSELRKKRPEGEAAEVLESARQAPERQELCSSQKYHHEFTVTPLILVQHHKACPGRLLFHISRNSV